MRYKIKSWGNVTQAAVNLSTTLSKMSPHWAYMQYIRSTILSKLVIKRCLQCSVGLASGVHSYCWECTVDNSHAAKCDRHCQRTVPTNPTNIFPSRPEPQWPEPLTRLCPVSAPRWARRGREVAKSDGPIFGGQWLQPSVSALSQEYRYSRV